MFSHENIDDVCLSFKIEIPYCHAGIFTKT